MTGEFSKPLTDENLLAALGRPGLDQRRTPDV
jgi:hypothetical protein